MYIYILASISVSVFWQADTDARENQRLELKKTGKRKRIMDYEKKIVKKKNTQPVFVSAPVACFYRKKTTYVQLRKR